MIYSLVHQSSWLVHLLLRLGFKTSVPTTEAEVTSRRMVSRPVRLGVLPLLEQVTRCYIYLSDNHFLYFSCREPSLTSGRVCNLQCNDASSISSYIATVCLSASSSWCRVPNGAHNQIHFFFWQLLCLLGVELPHPYPPWTGWSSPMSKSEVKVTLVQGEGHKTFWMQTNF
jgi:hypothetical protein